MKKLLAILFPLCFVACALIDDDLSVCGEEMVINYQMQLRTDLSAQLQTELAEAEDSLVREALKQWLSAVFSDKAKDIELHFFSAEEDIIRRRIQDVIDASQTSYTIKLLPEVYMHLALANIADNHQIALMGNEHSKTMELGLPNKTVLQSMNTGVFTARLPMLVEDKSASFDVYLYMVNAAVALVIDTTACDALESMSGTLNDGACKFIVRDSLFDYSRTCAFQLENVTVNKPSGAPQPKTNRGKSVADTPIRACLAAVGMPTRNDQPWTVTHTATLTGNRHTTTTLTIEEPLEAGTLRVIKLWMDKDGELKPEAESEKEVGVTVTLDWKDGGEHNIDL